MSKQLELEKLDRNIKDGNIRACTVKSNIEVLNRDIEEMCKLEIALEENLKCLKQSSTIAIASEFKKSKEDLIKTRVRLTTLMNERANYEKALENVNTLIQMSIESIEKIKKSGDNNVLYGDFGKKND